MAIELYTKIRKLNEQETENMYEADVAVNVDVLDNPNLDVAVELKKIDIKYELQLDRRDWGIGGFTAYPQGVADVRIETTDENDNKKEMDLKVDMSKVRVEWESGRSIAPIDLNLFIHANGEVDYGKSYIAFAFYDPTGE
jgi:hypothetical protein